MSTSNATLSRPPWWRVTILGASVALFTSWLAWRAAPLWDDAWIALARQAAVPLGSAFADRPLVGRILDLLDRTGWFWPLDHVAHWIHWTALSLTAAWFWLRFVSDDARAAAAAALLVLAPVLCEVQLVTASLVWNALTPVALAYAALVVVVEARRLEATRLTWPLGCLAVLAVLLACLVSEYGVPTALLAAVVVAAAAPRGRGGISRWGLPILMVAAAATGYAVLWSSAEVMRPDTRPEVALSGLPVLYFLKISTARLLEMLWRLGLGDSLEAIGSLRVGTSWQSASALLAGAAMAGAALVAVRRSHRAAAPPRNRGALLGLTALVAGLLPAVLMRRGVAGWASSRFWLPVLPVAACLTIWCWDRLLRRLSPRAVLALAAFLAGYHLWAQASFRVQQNAELARVGAALHDVVADSGLTLAIPLGGTEPYWSGRNDFDLTFHLTRDWDEGTRDRFWALPSWAWAVDEEGLDLTDPCDPPLLQRRYKEIERRGEVLRILWIDADPSSSHPVSRVEEFPSFRHCG